MRTITRHVPADLTGTLSVSASESEQQMERQADTMRRNDNLTGQEADGLTHIADMIRRHSRSLEKIAERDQVSVDDLRREVKRLSELADALYAHLSDMADVNGRD